MRVKQTAKKITTENSTVVTKTKEVPEIESSDHNSCDNQNDISDNEVEFLVESRRDQDGNQFLLDGTPVIEPAAVETLNESKENQSFTKEINFDEFIKEIQLSTPQVTSKVSHATTVTPKRILSSFGPNPTTFSTVKCTACNKKFNPFMGQTLFKHPLMEVILCSDCIPNQKEEFFVIDKDDNKETLCRWCVEGGSLICCDFCPKSFCKACIKRNLGRTTLSEILNQDDSVRWKCFVCEPKPIESLKVECRKACTDLRLFVSKQRHQKIAKKPIAKVAEIINKKRSISKAFPIEDTNGSPYVSTAKISTPSPINKPIVNAGSLLNNMSGFGTEWYMRNVKLRNIFTEIDEIDSRNLLNAINSTKKCVEAFYSDIRNLETEISKATTATEISGIASMFKSVYRHHIFNRFCQVKTRIEEDKKTKFVAQVAQNNNNNSNSNNGTEFNLIGIKNTHSIPSLTINNVVSTATAQLPTTTMKKRLSSLSPTMINNSSKKTKKRAMSHRTSLSNGNGQHRISITTSIDLTDDNDKSEVQSPPVPEQEHHNCHPVNSQENNIAAKLEQHRDDIVVDLCEDEDSMTATISYPVVNLNINNQLRLSADIVALDKTDN